MHIKFGTPRTPRTVGNPEIEDLMIKELQGRVHDLQGAIGVSLNKLDKSVAKLRTTIARVQIQPAKPATRPWLTIVSAITLGTVVVYVFFGVVDITFIPVVSQDYSISLSTTNSL